MSLLITRGLGSSSLSYTVESLSGVIEDVVLIFGLVTEIENLTGIISIEEGTVDMSDQSKSIYKNDDKTFRVTVVDDLNRPINITGYLIHLSIRYNDFSTASILEKDSSVSSEILITDAANGVAEIYFIPEDTTDLSSGIYIYDIKVTTGTGKVYTIVKDVLFIKESLAA